MTNVCGLVNCAVYSQVLSRPPKAPLEKQEARIKAGVRTMEAVEGKANTEP